jgi:hypothetical protein
LLLVGIVVVIIIFTSPCFIIIIITLLLVIVLVLSSRNGETSFSATPCRYSQSVENGTIGNVQLGGSENHLHKADQSVALAAPTETTPSPLQFYDVEFVLSM